MVKRMTNKEKAERAAIKKKLQADGILPPDKPRLNRRKFIDDALGEFNDFTMKQKLPGSQKKRKLPLIKLLIVYFELNWQAYAATIGASQPSVFNFFRYAFILRSLLN